MTFLTGDFSHDRRPSNSAAEPGPVLDETHWGYTIRDQDAEGGLRLMWLAMGRFLGAILLMVALGLWILPDSVHSPDLFTMKLAAMVMFTVIGGALVWTARPPRHLEFQIDTLRGEVRIGHRDLRGGFRLSSLVKFDKVASVYLLRAKDRSQPTRLFLRMPGESGAIEVARGTEAGLEPLRLRLTGDLAGRPRKTIGQQLARHGFVAA
jgi:hypothetical protein